MKIFIHKKYSVMCLLLLFMFAAMPVAVAYSGEDSFTQKDREMLIRVDERLNQIDKRFEHIDKRFEQIDKRFEQVDKRFEQVDKRFEELREDTNRRFEELREDINMRFESFQTLMVGVVATFGALVAAIIGFALWDRRTMIRPFETRIREIEEKKEDRENTTRILEALRKVARSDQRLAEALRSVALL